jgi:hypothetical protein
MVHTKTGGVLRLSASEVSEEMLQLSDATAIEFSKALEPTDNYNLVVVLLAHLIPHG